MKARFWLAGAVLWAWTALAASASPKQVTVSHAANGKVVKMAVGDTLTVDLSSNPTTGFMWRDKVEGKAVRPAGEPQYHGPKAPRPGAGGRQLFSYRAVRSGAGSIRLAYSRSWEKGKPPAQTYQIKVVVR